MATLQERTDFLEAALWHGSLERANQLLAEYPELAHADIHVSAVMGNASAVRDFIVADPASVHATSAPYDGDPLTYLCLSKYLRLDRSRSDAFLRTATTLLEAGADPNAGFRHKGEHETALYGAAGVAHHAGLTRLLIQYGANPNDPEVVYHTPEDWDPDALRAVVETGRLSTDSLGLMLLRKHDWHHLEGVRYLLEHGADPNHAREGWMTPLQHAIVRDNDLPIIELLLDHGADLVGRHPRRGTTSAGMAARRGRGDILQLAARRGVSPGLQGVEALLAACAVGDRQGALELARAGQADVDGLVADGGQVLAEFSGNDNTAGVNLLLDLGVPVNARFRKGDGYWGVAPDSTALHVAAWRAAHDTAKLLVERGADVNAIDGRRQSPLIMAIKACVDSYWAERRRPDSVSTLLAAGASTRGLPEKSGYNEVDALIAQHRRNTNR
jgi:ankyrin repeat protein